MKNFAAILVLLFTFFGITQAQINRYAFPQTNPVRPQYDLRFNCADLSVKLEIHQINKVGRSKFNLTFKATLKNEGRRNFNDQRNPALAYLRLSSNHPNAGEDVVMAIPALRAGESRVTYLYASWSSAWQVAPSVIFSLSAHPADCNRNNNKAVLSHRSILSQLRAAGRPTLPFGGF